MRLDSRHCKQKSAELRGDLFKEIKLARREGLIDNEAAWIVSGPAVKLWHVKGPIHESAALLVEGHHAPRLTGNADLHVHAGTDADIGACTHCKHYGIIISKSQALL